MLTAVSGAHDYRELANRPDVLTFDSTPLESDTEVTGPIHAQIYFSCDCRDTDLWVRLLDVAPDGTAFNLMSPGLDVLRASYRDLKKGRQLLKPHRVYRVASRQPDHQQRLSERAIAFEYRFRPHSSRISRAICTPASLKPHPHECRRQTYRFIWTDGDLRGSFCRSFRQ